MSSLTTPSSSLTAKFISLVIILAMGAALTVTSFAVTSPVEAAGSITSLKTVVDGQTAAGIGQTITYQIDLACSSLTDDCGQPTFTDILPAGVELVAVDTTGAPAWVASDDGLGTITVTRDPGDPIFADGDSSQFFITVRVTQDVDPDVDIVNTANVTSDNGTPDSPSQAGAVDATPREPKWETAKVQSAPPAGVDPAPNVPVEYELSFCGSAFGNQPLEDIVLVDQLPMAADGTVPQINDADGGVYDGPTNTISWTLDPVTAQDMYDAAVAGDEEICQVFTVNLTYPGSEGAGTGFVIGTDITNTATATDGPGVGDGSGICDAACVATSPALIAEGNSDVAVSKSGDVEISPSGTITYDLGIDTLSANISAANAVLSDDTPDELRIKGFDVTQSSQYGMEVWITEQGSVVAVQLDDIAQFVPAPMTSPANNTYRQSDFDTALSGVDVEVDKVELRFYTGTGGSKVYELEPTRTQDLTVYAQLRSGFTTVGATFENCAMAGTAEACFESEITADDAEFWVDKILSPTSVEPGETQTITLRMWANSNNALPIENPILFDLLPAEFEYLGDDTVAVSNSSGINVLPMPTLEVAETSFDIDDDFSSTGRTLVRFNFPGYELNWTKAEQDIAEDYGDKYIQVSFDVRSVAGTATGPYEDLGGGTTSSPVGTICPGSDGQSADDLNYDGSATTAVACFDTESTQVLPAAQLSGTKWDAGTLGIPHYNTDTDTWDDPDCPANATDVEFTRFPCAAQTVPGQPVDYLIEIQNSGNVPLDNYWLYDILPHVGDTGVGEPLYETARGSEFAVSITGPIVVSNLPSGAGTPVIEYSESEDPCRNEVANPGTPTPWPADCDDDWTATPASWSTVRSFRINVPFATNTFDGAETFRIEIPGFVPAGAPWDSIAWNSFAQRADNVSAGTSLLPTEPRQVGIRVPGLSEPDFNPASYPILYDQALKKTLDLAASPDLSDGVNAGDEVTFTLRVENQGQVIDSFSVVDYIDNTKFELFDESLQTTTATDLRVSNTAVTPGDPWTITWSGDGTAQAVASLTPNSGDLFIGDTIEFPIVLVIADTERTDGPIENWAEISAFDNSLDASSSALVDTDSTPDTNPTNDNQPDGAGEPGDDIVNGDGDPLGSDKEINDEDDHDVAGIPFWDLALVKELGSSQGFTIDTSTTPPIATWAVTVKNQGPEDAFLIEVTDQLPGGMSFGSLGSTTAGDAAVSTTATNGATGAITFEIDELLATGESVTFEFTTELDDATQVEYVNIAEISGFDDDSDANNAANPLATDTDSTPDAIPGNDVILTDPGTNADDDRNSHNDIDYDEDLDGNLNEPNPDDEDDHDQEVVFLPWDLALQKRLASPPTTPLVQGVSTVDFVIEIVNQGRSVQTVEITDYIDTDLFEALTVLPANGVVNDNGDGEAFDYTWSNAGAAPVVTVTGQSATDELEYGESVLIPVTLTIASTWDGTPLVNWAEISDFDNDLDPAVTANTAVDDDLFDADSTPNATQNDDNQPTGPGAPGDDVITGDGDGGNATTDDEDDHDVAGVPIWDLALIKQLGGSQPFTVDLSTTPPVATWSITVTNQGTEDVFLVTVDDLLPPGLAFNALGTITPGTTPSNVTTTALNGATGTIVFAIDALDAGDSVTWEFTTNVTDLGLTEFVNTAEISAFDDDNNAANAANPAAVDVDSTPDNNPTNDAILTDAGTDPANNDDRNSHNEANFDIDNDNNLNEQTTNPGGDVVDEDDHDQEVLVMPFDLALQKQLTRPPSTPLVPGTSTITFDLVVTNQGRSVQSIDLVDYIDTSVFDSFSSVLNPDSNGTTTPHVVDSGNGESFSYSWDGSDPANPVVTINAVAPTGVLFFDEHLTIPITLTVRADWDGSALVNWAEIARFDSDTNSSNGDSDPTNPANAAEGPFEDLDSTPNVIQGDDNQPGGPNQPGDDVITGNGVGSDLITNDEDDHDVAGVPIWDLELVKELGAGQTFTIDISTSPPTATWSITVNNQGTEDATFIAVTDQIPAGMTFASLGATTAGTAAVSTTASAGATGAIVFNIDALDADESVTFEFTTDVASMATGEFLNIAEISAFDDDGDPGNAANPLAVDIDSDPDAIPGNDTLLLDPSDANDDRNSNNLDDYDEDNDGNVNEVNPSDEDDHDQELVVLPYDLALRKVIGAAPTYPLVAGVSEITFSIEVTNQGRPVQKISIVDYIDPVLWDLFDVALNPDSDGVTTSDLADTGDGDLFRYTWDATDTANPIATLVALDTATGELSFDETLRLPITLRVDSDWDGADLINWAEISNFDNDTTPTNGDADPANPANAGTPLLDYDSTPDVDDGNDNQPTGPGQPGDNEITGDGDGADPVADDEDDHDVAGVDFWDLALIKELGTGQTYSVDPTAGPVTVTWAITVKNQGNNDAFLIDVTDQIPAGMTFAALGATTAGTAGVSTTASAGATGVMTFVIDELAAGDAVTFEFTMDMVDTTIGEYLNIAEISAFDDDNNPANAANPAAVDIDSTPDTDPNDDALLDAAGTDPAGNDDQNSHNDVDFDSDNDGNVNERELDSEGMAIDEDDHDQELIVTSFDLALEKTFTSGPSTPLTPGTSTVSFEIDVTNQGRPVRSLEVVDYIDPALWAPFSAVLNTNGSLLDTDGDTFTYVWDATNPLAPVISLETTTGAFGFNETLTIPITLTIAADWDGSDLVNWAEISNFDNDTDPTNGDADPDNVANGGDPFVDLDSTPNIDPDDDNQPTGPGADGDGVITGDGDGADPVANDEDDHDVAGVPIWDLALTKQLGATQPFVIDLASPSVTWSITVKNQGNQDAFLVAVTDQIPTGMEFSALGATTAGTANVTTGAAGGATGAIDFTIDALAAGDAVTFEFTTNVTDVERGEYLNIAEISAFDDDNNPANAANPAAFDVDSLPDTNPANDDVLVEPGTDPASNDDRNSHNEVDYDADEDGNVNETSADDEDDHDQELVVAVFDLALEKTLAVYPTTPIAPGTTTVGFELEITNQGRPVRSIEVVDYIDASLWSPFVAADNPDSDGVIVMELADSGDGDLFTFVWDGSLPLSPIVSLTALDPVNGELGFGETLIIPITLTIAEDWAGDPLVNWAEISNFDNDTDPTNGDADPDNVANGGDPFVDLDSTPNIDPDDDNQPTGPGADGDGVITGDGDGADPVADDEDDHDVAGVPIWDLALTKQLGGIQTYVVDLSTTPPTVLWSITVKNQGDQDAFLIEVTDHLPVGMEFAMLGATTAGTASVTTSATDGASGTIDFMIDALAAGDAVTFEFRTNIVDATQDSFVNIAEISAFDDDADADNASNPIAVDIDSVPDTNASNDVVLVAEGTDPNGNDDTNSHNDVDYDADADGNLNEPTVDGEGNIIDEDDHGQERVVLPYDLALAKTLNPTTVFPLRPGSPVTFDITVTNQGRAVEDFTVVDYIDLAVWQPFDATLNADGTVGALSYAWDTSDPANPVVSFDGVLALTESVTVPVTLVVADDYATSTSPLENWAEISSFDDDGDPTTAAPTDLDSTPNAEQGDDNQPTGFGAPGDDIVHGDGSGTNPILGDEDDHDVAGVLVLDLALVKTLNDTTELPVLNGSSVTFDITLINQGSLHVTNPTVTDYVDVTNWEPFDVAQNPAGTTTGSQELPFSWTAAGTNGELALVGTLAPGDVVVATVTLTINDTSTLEELVNRAEISTAPPTDADGTPVLNPDGSTPVDIDSTPDADAEDDNQPASPGDPTDDAVDNSDGPNGADEDDHDIAGVTAPTYSVGNQVWFDTNDDGFIGADEGGIDGVTVQIWSDLDGNGELELVATTVTMSIDLDGNGAIDLATEAGLYLFDGLARGEYEIVIPASNFDEGAPLAKLGSSTPTSSDPNDDTDNDDNGIVKDDHVRSGPVFIGPGMPAGESPDNDLVTPDPHENLTVDFGFNTFSLGNELWFDLDDNGFLDVGEPPVVGAIVELFIDADDDGFADDQDGDGVLTSADAIASVTTTDQGEFLFDGLRPGNYIVGVPPSQFAEGGVLWGYRSSTPTTADPDDDRPSDDNGALDPNSEYVITGAITISTNEPTGEIDDNDPNTPDANENLTIDLGFWKPTGDDSSSGAEGSAGGGATGASGASGTTTGSASGSLGGAAGTGDGALAITGTNTWVLVRLSTLMIVLGSGLLLAARFREDDDED